MADRLSQYPMVPPPFNSSMLQQQQLSQSQQQSQVDSQSVSFSNSEHGRMWQQMQQHMQNSYPNQSAGDMQGTQISQRVADMLRSQNMARAQGQQQINQQQINQQQINQQFGLPPQMGALAQQPPFHDPTPQRNQSHIPPNFPNMGITNASQFQPSLTSRNPMLQPFSTNNPAHTSRLDLMGLTHNQQSQNTFATRIVQQSQHQANINSQPGQNQPSQPDLFLSPGMAPSDGIRRSPSQSTQPPGSVGKHPPINQATLQGLPAGRRPMTFPELRERAQQLQSVIHQLEGVTTQLSNHRAGMSDADYIVRMQATTNEIKGHKDMLAKVIQALSQAAPQPNTNGPSGGNIGNLNGTSSQSQQQSGPVQVSQSQSQWMSRPGSSPPQGFGSTASHGSSQSHNIQPSPLQLHAQLNSSQPQNMVPPRPVPPPQQLLPGQIPRQVSPTITNQYSLQISGHSNVQPRSDQSPQVQFMQMPPALEKARFDTAYKSYCNSKGIKHDTRLMSVDNRPIDLHLLHSQVMEEGGVTKVNQKELWAIIGARMGFVQFPGTESEPAKSGPGVAQHLAHVYKEYLSSFDNVYIQSVIDSKRKMQAQSGASQNTPRTITNAQQMQALIAYANLPAHELRKKGVAEKFIQFVEANRDQLQHSAKMQQMWRGNLVKPSLPGSSGPDQEQDRTMSDASAPFPRQNPNLPPSLQHPGSRPGQYVSPQQPGTSSIPGGSNNMDAQFSRQPQGPSLNGVGPSPATRLPRPTQEQLQHALQFIAKVKQDFLTRTIQNMPLHVIPDDQRMEYSRAFEQLHRYAVEVEPRLPMFCILLKQEDPIRKLIAIILTVQHQRNFLSSNTPKYIIDLHMIHAMITQMQQANEIFSSVVSSIITQQQSSNTSNTPSIAQQRPPVSQPPPSHSFVSPPTNRPVPLTPAPPSKKKPPPNQPGPSNSTPPAPISTSAVVSTPTPPPAPSVTTPIANPPTPTNPSSSPQGSKSPKTKAAPKPKVTPPAKRKASKNVPPAELAPPASSKRLREEEVPPSTPAPSSDHSPKRVKTEWEGAPSEGLVKRHEEVESIKTEEDASAFFEHMTELMKLAAGGQGQESLSSDISETLAVILKGCGAVPDAPESSTMASLSLDGGTQRDSPAPPPTVDEFIEFFDFSSFGTLDDDDSGSKAPTPDLLSSSSTNPSPESGSEVEAVGHPTIIDSKTDESLHLSDSLRLGPWKEIDGGESAYYQQSDWKWDSPMPTLEQPWAIFTS